MRVTEDCEYGELDVVVGSRLIRYVQNRLLVHARACHGVFIWFRELLVEGQPDECESDVRHHISDCSFCGFGATFRCCFDFVP